MNARKFLASFRSLPSDSKHRYVKVRMASVLEDAVNESAMLDHGQRCFVTRAIELAAEDEGKLFRPRFSQHVLAIAGYINTCK